MRWLINYIRSYFCKHDFELIKYIEVYSNIHDVPIGYKWIYRCRKCGYIQKIKS